MPSPGERVKAFAEALRVAEDIHDVRIDGVDQMSDGSRWILVWCDGDLFDAKLED